MPSMQALVGAIVAQAAQTVVPTKTTGTVFYVSSTTAGASDGNDGLSPVHPFATLAHAISLCTANVGDVIYVMPGHAETIIAAQGINANIAGITIIGLGNGTNRPTITFGTATTATFYFGAANVTVRNIRFVNNIDSLAKFIDGAADNATLEDCWFFGSSTKEFLCGVAIPTTYDNWAIRRCHFIQPTDPNGINGNAGTGAIYLSDSENVVIEECEFRGCFETACIHNKTTGAANLWVFRCYGFMSTSTADALPFVLAASCSGGADRCSIVNPNSLDVTEATFSGTFPALFYNFQSYFGNDGGGGQLAVASQGAAS